MKTVSLSDGEWKLMNLLWEQAPCTITQLVAALRGETAWSKHTVISMLSRLEVKGAVVYRAGERAKQFYPDIDREQAQREETKSFLSRLYGGSLGLMVSTMLQEKELTREELEELYSMLKQAEEKLS